MEIKPHVDPQNFEIGVLIARFQIDDLHHGHKELIDFVLNNHDKVIIFLGNPRVQNSRKNPLDFAMRCAMVREHYPDVMILPLDDQRSNKAWSKKLDEEIRRPYGDRTAVLYGSRDSFIPFYSGKYNTIELQNSVDANASEVREKISKRLINDAKFRAGVIHATYAQRPTLYPAVDVVVYNDEGKILLGRKGAEKKFRFIGGFVDPSDVSYEAAASRELREETEVTANFYQSRYVLSHNVDDWRYKKDVNGIMTTLFLVPFATGAAKASDDIAEVAWVPANKFTNQDGLMSIMPEHREMMAAFIKKVYDQQLIPNLGPKIAEREGVTYFADED